MDKGLCQDLITWSPRAEKHSLRQLTEAVVSLGHIKKWQRTAFRKGMLTCTFVGYIKGNVKEL